MEILKQEINITLKNDILIENIQIKICDQYNDLEVLNFDMEFILNFF